MPEDLFEVSGLFDWNVKNKFSFFKNFSVKYCL